MQTAKDLAPARKEPQSRGTETRTPNAFKIESKPAPTPDNNDAPLWDEV